MGKRPKNSSGKKKGSKTKAAEVHTSTNFLVLQVALSVHQVLHVVFLGASPDRRRSTHDICTSRSCTGCTRGKPNPPIGKLLPCFSTCNLTKAHLYLQVWRAGTDTMQEGEALDYDPTAYDCLHQFTLDWPCLR